jgi:hypothetical protein
MHTVVVLGVAKNKWNGSIIQVVGGSNIVRQTTPSLEDTGRFKNVAPDARHVSHGW